MSEALSVVSLKIKNFMSISDVEIKPGQVNQIVGKNEQGKTTILKAIETAIKGSSDGNLVKHGEEQSEIVVELKDEYVVKRNIKADGKSTVSLTRGFDEDKERIQAPQGKLDILFDNVAFNPIDLLDPKKRNESIMASIALSVTPQRLAEELGVTIEDLPPLDYKKHGLHVLDQCYKYFYQRRAEANKDAETKKQKHNVNAAEMKSFSEPEKTKDAIATERKTINDKIEIIKSDRQKVKEFNMQVESANKRLDEKEKIIKEYDDQIEKLEKEIEKVKNLKAGYIVAVGEIEKKALVSYGNLDELEKSAKEMLAALDLEDEKHKTYESNLNQVKMLNQMKTEYETAFVFAEELTRKVDILKSELKKKMLAEVDMPIEGLEFLDGEFTLHGSALDLLSSSAALKLAIAIARKLAKRTKLICIDGAEMIDDENFLILSAEIANDGFTYFITRVGEPIKVDGQKIFRMENGGAVEV